MSMVFCRGCAKEMHESALSCPHCGAVQGVNNLTTPGGSEKRILPAFLLCILFGIFGVHRFYVGKIGTGIFQLLTLGIFGIWTLIDLIMIICGIFRDAAGKKITQWT